MRNDFVTVRQILIDAHRNVENFPAQFLYLIPFAGVVNAIIATERDEQQQQNEDQSLHDVTGKYCSVSVARSSTATLGSAAR